MSQEAVARAARIKLMIFDVDGVLTDGGLHYGADGEMIKRFHVQDGLGIRLLQDAGIQTAIITARQTPIISRRATDLGIQHVQQGVQDKGEAFEQLLRKTGLSEEECGYAGDDWIDLPVMLRVAFAASVPNGHPEVVSRAHFVSQSYGGDGAVRNICDFILRANGHYLKTLERFLP